MIKLDSVQDAEGGHYELFHVPTDGRGGENVDSKRGLGVSAVFVGRKRFAVLDKSNQVSLSLQKNNIADNNKKFEE